MANINHWHPDSNYKNHKGTHTLLELARGQEGGICVQSAPPVVVALPYTNCDGTAGSLNSDVASYAVQPDGHCYRVKIEGDEWEPVAGDWYDPATDNPVFGVMSINQNTGVPTVTWYNLDGTVFPGQPEKRQNPVDYSIVTGNCREVTTAGTGYAVGDKITPLYFYDISTDPLNPALIATLYRNDTQNSIVNNAVLADSVLCPESITVQSLSEIPVCADGKEAIRKTVVYSDGTDAVEFQDETGVITPTTWTFGACPTAAPTQVDQTHNIVTGTGNIPAGLKSVTINNLSGNTTVAGGYVLGNGRRDNSLSLNATEVDPVRGLLPAITVTGGTWQWIGIEPIAEI